VGMHDIGAHPPHRLLDLSGIEPTREHCGPGPRATSRPFEICAGALQDLDGMAAFTQQGGQLGDGALLTAGRAVTVVQDQYVHGPDRRTICLPSP
jgi:hypothetical protein